jgi:phosphatidylserine decarboxylase
MCGADRIRIQVLRRDTGELEDETICGEDLMRLFYGTPTGFRINATLFVHRWLSFLGGLYYDTPLSRRKIVPFARELAIDLEECDKPVREYRTFNEFFARGLKPGSRPVAPQAGRLVSPGDGRLLVFPEIAQDTLSYVKWAPIRLLDLFAGDPQLVRRYQGGACAVLRLCPADYHRFHFPTSGRLGPTRNVKGLLHSVNPFVLEQKLPVFALNKRTMTTLDSGEFGQMLLMEVGAMGVGGIVQTATVGAFVERGDEKGFFKFGGSTTILFAEPGRLSFDPDLIANSQAGLETLVRMGEGIGQAAPLPA